MTDDKKIVVSRLIDAPAKDIFDVLTLPQRHREFDASGTIESDDKTQRIQAVGDVFTMNMHREPKGDYKTDNHVNALIENKVVGWATAPEGQEPPGWTWLYELDAQGPGSTEVTLTYDWSNVDSDFQRKESFPAFKADDLEQSLNLLAAAVA
ncbi:SRPBCC family protein [Nigerium massiliense]|uniref:SRPBCC family protein n=1 Tax=Nigerium massiliense TaxID=1522317 RepID=UPI00058E59B3|nr:SRPBCC family protein [Nigerium massiliense]